MASPFKVGDILVGTSEADREYTMTTSQATVRVQRVEEILSMTRIDVEIIAHKTEPELVGRSDLTVDPAHFVLKVEAKDAPPPTFKAGDRVRHIHTGRVTTVKSVPGMAEYDSIPLINAEAGMVVDKATWVYREHYELDLEATVKATVEAKGMGTWSLDNE